MLEPFFKHKLSQSVQLLPPTTDGSIQDITFNHLYHCSRNFGVVCVWHTMVCEAFLSYTIVFKYSLRRIHGLAQGLCHIIVRPVLSRRRTIKEGKIQMPHGSWALAFHE